MKTEKINWKDEYYDLLVSTIKQNSLIKRALDGWDRTIKDFDRYFWISILFQILFFISGLLIGIGI